MKYSKIAGTGSYLPETVFTNVHPYDQSVLIDDIARMLDFRLTPQDTVVCPLSIGNHVDHVLTRRAVECSKHSAGSADVVVDGRR